MRGPLEKRMHAARTFALVEEFSILGDDFARLKDSMLQCILMTDMANHGGIMVELNAGAGAALLADPPPSSVPYQFLLNVLLHSADIGAQLLLPKVSLQWSQRVLEEFMEISRAEQAAGVGFSPSMVAPLWAHVFDALEPMGPRLVSWLRGNLEANRTFWDKEAKRHAVSQEKEKEKRGDGTVYADCAAVAKVPVTKVGRGNSQHGKSGREVRQPAEAASDFALPAQLPPRRRRRRY